LDEWKFCLATTSSCNWKEDVYSKQPRKKEIKRVCHTEIRKQLHLFGKFFDGHAMAV
jgi:hypothetical protein